jgi:hypothetical protein
MTKTVFDNHMTAHVWAQGSQYEGRSHNGNFYFEGPRLYSYGSHYVAAYLLPNGDALVNDTTYSVSTTRHTSYAMRAVRGRALRVPNLTELVRYFPCFHDDTTWKPNKTRIAELLEKRAASMSESAVSAILEFIGSRANAQNIIDRSLQNEAQRKAKRDKELRDFHANKARQFASLSDDEIANRLGRIESDWRDKLEDESKVAYRALREAKARNWNRVAEGVSSYRSAIRDRIAEREKARKHRERNGLTIDAIKMVKFPSGSGDIHAGASYLAKDGRFLSDATRDELKTLARYAFASSEFKRAMAARKKRIDNETAFNEWMNGERASFPYGYGARDNKGSVYMRVVGDELQTSMGARVPLRHAKRAYRMALWCRDNGRDWKRNGATIRVGMFQVDRIDTEGNMIAGCHRLSLERMKECAGIAGIELEPVNVLESEDA